MREKGLSRSHECVLRRGSSRGPGASPARQLSLVADVSAFIHRHEERNRRGEQSDLFAECQGLLTREVEKGALGHIGTPLTKQNQRDGKNGGTIYQKTDILRALPKLVKLLYKRIEDFTHEDARLAKENVHLRQLLGPEAGHADGYFGHTHSTCSQYSSSSTPGLCTPVSDWSSQPPSPKRVKEDSSPFPEPRSVSKDCTCSWRKRR